MRERRRRTPGTSPGGRGGADAEQRRSARAAKKAAARAETAARDEQAAAPKSSAELVERARPVRIPERARPAGKAEARGRRADQVERTILGLSTGRALILAAVTSALALTLAVPLRTYFSQSAETTQINADHTQLEADVKQLREKKAQQNDPAYIRAEARTRLRLVDPGETPYIVQLPGAYEASRQAAAEPPKPSGPWYSELWNSVSRPRPVPVEAPPPAPSFSPQPAGQVK